MLKPQYFGSSGYPFMDTITLSQSGTTTLLITSITGISGSMTLTVYQVPADFSQSISPTATGVGVTVETTTPGQNARITFTGMPGERISVNSSTWPWGDRNSRISVINPDGTTLLNPQYFGSSGYPFMDDVTLSQSGSYTIVIDPIGAATTGTAGLPVIVYQVPADWSATISPTSAGVTSTMVTATPGQNAKITFQGSMFERISVNSSNWPWGDRNSRISVINPDGTTLLNPQYFGSSGYPFMDIVTLMASGTYTILIDPLGSATTGSGGMPVTVYQVPPDFTAAITPTHPGVAVPVSITTPGQNAQITFQGTPGERIFTNSTSPWPWGDRNSRITIINPDGSYMFGETYFGSSGYPYLDAVTLRQSGTYTIFIDAVGAATTPSPLNVTVYQVPDDNWYAVAPTSVGASVNVVNTTPGQNGWISFPATANDTITVTSSNWPWGDRNSRATLLNPDGTTLLGATYFGSSGYPSLRTVTVALTGSYTLLIDPVGAATTGTAGMTVTVSDGGANSQGAAVAQKFMPILNFDSSEKWRPLNVAMFMAETDPTTGSPWNQVCSSTTSCSGLNGDASLQGYPGSGNDIMIHNSGGDPDTYTSPNPSCQQQVLHDCDSGPASAIYYHIVGPSPGGYTYYDYWFLFRYNQGWNDIGNHAGDWEGLTVAPAANGQTFEFAEFSEHGTWTSFLRGNLECDYGGVGSCGSDPTSNYYGQHVMTFPAAGSHANYPAPNSGPSTDGSTNGQAPWGNNLNSAALIAFPPDAPQNTSWLTGPEQWTDWPGTWGDTQGSSLPWDSKSPCSPAASCSSDHAGHFFAPWSGVSCPSGTACPAAVRAREPLACSDWFGAPVAVLGCTQSSMRRALRSRKLGRPGHFSIYLVSQRRRAATAPGLAQVLGHPLRPGEGALLSGVVPFGTTLFVRALEGRRLVTAIFDDIGPFRGRAGRAVIRVRRGRRGYPVVAVVLGARDLAPTLTVRELLPPHRRQNLARAK